MKTSGHFYYAVCKIYRFGQAREIRITCSLSRPRRHYQFLFFFLRNAEHRPGSTAPQVDACRPATQRRQLGWKASSERPWGCLSPGRDRSDGKDPVDTLRILETSGDALKADEWKQAEHIQWTFSASNSQGRAHSYSTGQGGFNTGSHSPHLLLDLLSDANVCSHHAVDSPLHDQPCPPVLPAAVTVSLLQKYVVPTGSLHPVRFWSSEQQHKDPVVGSYDFWKIQFPLNQRLATFTEEPEWKYKYFRVACQEGKFQNIIWWVCTAIWGFLSGSGGRESACNMGDLGSILGLGRSPGGGNGNPLHPWRIPMERGALRAIVHVVAKSQKWLSN